MRLKKLIFSLLIIAIVGCLAQTDSWAITAYMRVEGGNQGNIPGDANDPGHEGWITVASFGHNMNVPTDPQTGRPIGTLMHGPIRIVKPLDRASAMLYAALAAGELLTRVEIQFMRLNVEGQMEHFYTILLEDARITSASPSLIPSNQDNLMMEIISFVYNRITCTYVPDSIEFQDDVASPH
jgi:type VI secretion system secreted protein Hcp